MDRKTACVPLPLRSIVLLPAPVGAGDFSRGLDLHQPESPERP
jgi:hypothetical protein